MQPMHDLPRCLDDGRRASARLLKRYGRDVYIAKQHIDIVGSGQLEYVEAPCNWSMYKTGASSGPSSGTRLDTRPSSHAVLAGLGPGKKYARLTVVPGLLCP